MYVPITTPASVCTSVRVACVVRQSARRQLGETEVEHFHQAVLPDDHVLGFEIAMDDPDRVRGADAGGDLNRDVERVLKGWRLPVQR